MSSYWHNESNKIIDKVIKEKGKLITLKDIDEAYPFGERARHPYKMWLKARKEKAIKLGLLKIDTSNQDMGLFKEHIND
ncbi:hypothetical protein [Arcobacter lacus]|uniref:Uncharacterized protein n=1 Tax=Arcobacter lacus TaxID=1912876 RepID=A0ABX5JH76_9BACT|nr:hypothetical protein [Arcobacter lacus]PUE66739.1 hypothetical protein B0175_05075 [Arcobacter lacus]